MGQGLPGRWRARLPRLARRDMALLTAAVLVAAGTILALVGFTSYERGYAAAAADAATAELAASRLNGLQSEAVSDGRLPPGAVLHARQLLGSLRQELRGTGSAAGVSRRELASYFPAVQADLRLVAEGLVARARRLDDRRVDPAFRELGDALRRLAARNSQASDHAGTLAEIGGITAASVGFLLVVMLLLGFATTRRALATAEVEQNLLRRSDRAKSELISVVSHDLRTPLTAILGYVEILADEEAGPISGAQRKLLGVMRRNGARLLAIVDDLLYISSIRDRRLKLDLEELSLEEAAAEVVGALRGQAERKGIRLSLRTRPCPPVAGDRQRVGEMVTNLVSNAVKFTPAGGSVWVAVHPAGGRARIEVTDTGPGISPEDREHVFDHFYRSPDMAGLPGVGLGLAIVKSIADAHGADVSVRGAVGEGATFQVDFPAAAPVITAAGPPPGRRAGEAPHPSGCGELPAGRGGLARETVRLAHGPSAYFL